MGKQGWIYCLVFLLSVIAEAGIDAGSGKGTNFATPTADTDAANKKYVDDNISGPGGIHNFMAVAHGDTTNSTPPARGSMIVGNATPLWNEFLIGANEKVWVSDGTDPSWGTVDISGGTNLTVTAPITLTDDDIGFDDSAYSLIDGTRPFTGTVGGILPVNGPDLATKEYVDTAISFIFEFFFNDTASDIGGIYFKMLDTTTGEAESSFTTAGLGTGDDQALTNFITDPNFPGITELVEGIYEGHVHVEKTVGTKPVKVHFEVYSRAIDTTETLIATSEESDFITANVQISLHAALASEVMILTTDRIVIKWLANVDATGSNATIVLYAEGTNASHLAMPTSTEVLNQIYIRQDGTEELTANWDAGPFNIRSQTGTIDEGLTVNNDEASQNHLTLKGAFFTSNQRGGSIEWEGGKTAAIEGYTYLSLGGGAGNGEFVWDTAAQSSVGDRGTAHVRFNDGSASFAGGNFTIASTGNTTIQDEVKIDVASPSSGWGLNIEYAVAGGGTWNAANLFVDGDSIAAIPLRLQGGLDTPAMNDQDFIMIHDGNGTLLGSAEHDVTGVLQWETASDRRIKTNISVAETDPDILTKFSNLKISNFAMKKSPDAIHTGFIAQDLQEQFPELVGTKTLYNKINLTKGEKFDALTQILLNEANDAISSDTIENRDVEVAVFDEELGRDVKVIESHRFRIVEQECLGVKGNMNVQFTMAIAALIELAQTQQAEIEDLTNRVKVLEMR